MLEAKLTEKRVVVGGRGPNAVSTEAHSFGG